MGEWESQLESKISYFCKKGMMDVLVEGALTTPSAYVEHFLSSQAMPNIVKQPLPTKI